MNKPLKNLKNLIKKMCFFLVLANPHGGGGGSVDHEDNHLLNGTHVDRYEGCGANFYVTQVDQHNGNLARPPDSEIYTISSIYLACIFVAVAMIALFVDPLSR